MYDDTKNRIIGGFNAFMGGLFGCVSYHYFGLSYFDLVSIFSQDMPLSSKLTGAVLYLGLGMEFAASNLLTIDGFVDMAEGTSSYFLAQEWWKPMEASELRNSKSKKTEMKSRLEEKLKLISNNP